MEQCRAERWFDLLIKRAKKKLKGVKRTAAENYEPHEGYGKLYWQTNLISSNFLGANSKRFWRPNDAFINHSHWMALQHFPIRKNSFELPLKLDGHLIIDFRPNVVILLEQNEQVVHRVTSQEPPTSSSYLRFIK